MPVPIKVHTKALWARTKAKEISDAKAMEAAAAKAAVKLAREQAKKDIKQSQAAKRGRPPAKTNQPPAAKQESGSEVDDELWPTNTKKKKSKK